MKALQIRQYGGKDVLELNQNAPNPVPGKEQVLVEVHAASLNPVDWKIRAGYLKEMAPLTMPATLGGDVSGIVAAVGTSVSTLKVGGQITEKSFKVLRKGGTLVSMVGQPNPELAQKAGVTAIGQMTHANTEVLKRLAQFVDSGAMKIRVGKVFPLEKA
ncbi:MAG: alcohol dehydrogenase catalytic domain-containing protein, partial [Nitrospiraceae bacterium]